MRDSDIARVLAIAAEIAGDDDLEVIKDGEPEPPSLSGGLTPDEALIPVRVGGQSKRNYTNSSIDYN